MAYKRIEINQDHKRKKLQIKITNHVRQIPNAGGVQTPSWGCEQEVEVPGKQSSKIWRVVNLGSGFSSASKVSNLMMAAGPHFPQISELQIWIAAISEDRREKPREPEARSIKRPIN